MKKALSAILVSTMLFSVLVVLIGILPMNTFAAEKMNTGFEGKTISILGDSISTYVGVSDDATANSTLAGSVVYYNGIRNNVYLKDTWWQQAIDQLGMELLVNNSWSGSCVLTKNVGSEGAYIDRCVQLHNAAGTDPDIIAVYMGTNDLWALSSLGTATSIAYDTLINADGDGFCYAVPKTSCEAYAIMLHKMKQRYPRAEIYCFTLLQQNNISEHKAQLLKSFNASIAQIADHFGAYTVDLYNDCGVEADENFSFYMVDNNLHPGTAGMDAITGCFTSSLLKNSRYINGTVYNISYKLGNLIIDQGTKKAVLAGDSFSCSFTIPAEKCMNLSVTMDGVDITDRCRTDNRIYIENVSGNIHIIAQDGIPSNGPNHFRWEYIPDQMVSISELGNTFNPLTMVQGTIENGILNNVYYTLNKVVALKHNEPWFLEWRSEITDTLSTYGGALMFASSAESTTNNHPYLFCPQNGKFLALGVYDDGSFHNYGVSLSEHGIDGTLAHTYRLENRLFDDGTNMIYLFVDDQELGPMNHLWIGMSDKNETENWVNGQDFNFTHMGTSSHSLSNFKFDYIQVSEDGHSHSYATSVTVPTCTEQGYSTYTCPCGNSYVADYTDAAGHDYQDGACSDCGKAIPVLTLRSPTLEFKDMIKVVAFFTAENTEDVVEMGMITYSSRVSQYSIDTAENVIPGAVYVESSGRYYATSQGIHAKQLADKIYLAVYAKLTNGDYVYSPLASYSATTYAYNQLTNSDDVKLKQLVVSMLNYGAQAQRYFSHNLSNLANAGLTREHEALPEAYRSEMVPSVPVVSDEKQGTFLNNQGFTSRKPAVSFEGAFCINYFFSPADLPDGEITMYYWNEADFQVADVVTAENATGSLVMTQDSSGQYRADITGIAAKDLSATVYAAAIYSNGTEIRTSGVLGYSIGAYCGSQAAKGGAVADLAKATAVYGHHAKEYFG